MGESRPLLEGPMHEKCLEGRPTQQLRVKLEGSVEACILEDAISTLI
jgi:hypothetical protein